MFFFVCQPVSEKVLSAFLRDAETANKDVKTFPVWLKKKEAMWQIRKSALASIERSDQYSHIFLIFEFDIKISRLFYLHNSTDPQSVGT